MRNVTIWGKIASYDDALVGCLKILHVSTSFLIVRFFYIIFFKSIFDWKFSYVELEEPGQWWEMLQYEPKLGESYY